MSAGKILDDVEIEQTEESEEQEETSLKYQISSYPSDITLQGYLDKDKAGQLVIPEFQREYVWDLVMASKLIESFLIGLPVPGVFLYKETKSNKLLVIDGQQRIMSAIRYFKGTFEDKVFRLKNVREPWKDRAYSELTEADRFQLQDAVLRATIIQQLDPSDNSSIYHIFERLNAGGVNLGPMEIRKCIFSGWVYDLLAELNRNSNWRKIIGAAKIDKRLKDVELVLRVLAFTYSWASYEKPMKSFLNEFMSKHLKCTPAEAIDLSKDMHSKFIFACDTIVSKLGAKPFHLRGRLNLGVLDSVFGIIASSDDIEDALATEFQSLLKDELYLDAVSRNTSDKEMVLRRFNLTKEYLTAP